MSSFSHPLELELGLGLGLGSWGWVRVRVIFFQAMGRRILEENLKFFFLEVMFIILKSDLERLKLVTSNLTDILFQRTSPLIPYSPHIFYKSYLFKVGMCSLLQDFGKQVPIFPLLYNLRCS